MNDQHAPLPWVNAFDAKDGATGLTVRVQRKGDIRPRYSIQIGKPRELREGDVADDRLGSYLPIFVEGYGQGHVTARREMEACLPGLLKQALDFIEADAQTYENVNTDRRIARDERDGDRNGGSGNGHRRTGKTERNREKHRRRDRDEG